MKRILICKGVDFCVASPYNSHLETTVANNLIQHCDFVAVFTHNGIMGQPIKNRTMQHLPAECWQFLDDEFHVLNKHNVGIVLHEVSPRLRNMFRQNNVLKFNKHNFDPDIILDFITLV